MSEDFLNALAEFRERPPRPPIIYRIHYEEDGFIKHFSSCDMDTDLPKIILDDPELIKTFKNEGTGKYIVKGNDKIVKRPVNNVRYTQLKQVFTVQECQGCSIIYVTEKGHPALLLDEHEIIGESFNTDKYDFYVKRREL